MAAAPVAGLSQPGGDEKDDAILLKPGASGPVALITFDLDDTLWHAGPLLMSAYATRQRFVAERHPKIAAEFPDLPAHLKVMEQVKKTRLDLAHSVSATHKEAVVLCAKAVGYSDEQAQAAKEEVFSAFLAARQEAEPYLFEEALPLLARLRAKGIKVHLGIPVVGSSSN